MGLTQLVEISRFYGSNSEFVIAGGGNTSYKDDTDLYIKASGSSLADIGQENFVRLNRKKLNEILWKEYSRDSMQREKEVLADLLASRVAGETNRPSVESLLHSLIEHKYVLHTHPTVVNALTCSRWGEQEAKKIFGNQTGWLPTTNPGYIMALTAHKALTGYKEKHGEIPGMLLVQNHGLFVGASSPREVKAIHASVIETLTAGIKRKVDISPMETNRPLVELRLQQIRELEQFAGYSIKFAANHELRAFLQSRETFRPVAGAFTPDHIVYAGVCPLFVDNPEQLEEQATEYLEQHGKLPKIIAMKDLGIVACGQTEKAADTALLLFLDAVKIAVYTENFGGYLFMPKNQVRFIENWETERFRAGVNLKES